MANVLISYSRLQSEQMFFLKEVIEQAGHNTLIDEDAIVGGDLIPHKISNMIEDADVVLCILTEDSLSSLNVYEELIRADERRRPIIPVSFTYYNQKNKIPHFLEKSHLITIKKPIPSNKEKNAVLKAISSQAEMIDELGLSETNSLLRRIQDSIIESNKETSPSFSSRLAQQILSEADREIDEIVSCKYNVDIGKEKNFLVRAKTIFEMAESVYAISIDRVSTFWKDAAHYIHAQKYIENQPSNTNRLYVFSSPKSAHRFRKILQANYLSYGKKGGIYLCDSKAFMSLINSWKQDGTNFPDRILDRDFGLLDFGTRKMQATLDSSALSFGPISTSYPFVVDPEKFCQTFKNLKRIKKGCMSRREKVVRWSQDLAVDDQKWGHTLERLFDTPRGEYVHLVFFREPIEHNLMQRFEKTIYEVKKALRVIQDEKGEEWGWISTWFGEYSLFDVQDGLFRAPLASCGKYKYVVMMRFSSEHGLNDYYEHLHHAEARRHLYSNVSSNLRFLYNYMDGVLHKNKSAKKAFSDFFSCIETMAADYIVRSDFTEMEPISRIIENNKPYEFSLGA